MANKKTIKKTIDKLTQDELNWLYTHIEVLKETVAKQYNTIVLLKGQIENQQDEIYKMKSFLGWHKHHEA
tara:strand:+ start:7884 stop:8093 length:210 start_codon:yes stop_codon:yes gene_type:complete